MQPQQGGHSPAVRRARLPRAAAGEPLPLQQGLGAVSCGDNRRQRSQLWEYRRQRSQLWEYRCQRSQLWEYRRQCSQLAV